MTLMHTTPTFVTKVYCLVTHVQMFLKCKCELMYSTSLLLFGWFVHTTRSTTMATPTNNIDYSCHLKAVELAYNV